MQSILVNRPAQFSANFRQALSIQGILGSLNLQVCLRQSRKGKLLASPIREDQTAVEEVTDDMMEARY